jgi:GPH family glycoside/pentoside/hexuronide:cation symporter
MNHPIKKLTRGDILAYAQLAFPLAFAGLPLYIHAPDFYATQYGASLTFLGGALLAIRLIDAFADPLIGRLCDGYSHRRAAIMAVAAGLFALSFAALYQPPPALEIFWFVATVFIATLSFSVLLINLNAIGSLAAAGESEKTSTSVWREAFGVAGLVIAMILPAILGNMKLYALFCAACTIISAAIFIGWLRKKNISIAARIARLSWRSMLSGDFKAFFAAYGVSMLASSFPAVLFLFFIRDWLGAEEKSGLFLMVYFFCALLAMPLWKALSLRFPAGKLWLASMCISAFGISLAMLVQPQGFLLYALVCILSGIGFGGEIFLPPAILSSRISRKNLDAHTSSYFGLYAFFMKAALALATAAAFITLDYAGFKPGVTQGCCGQAALVGLYAALPAVIKLVAIIVLFKSGVYHEKIPHNLPIGSRHVS